MKWITSIAAWLCMAACFCAASAAAQSLVLLHTNDTHSHIDADNGVGGVLQRKAIVDSIRRAEKHVMLIDAGDIVQGTLYYKLFGGRVEYPLMELLGYDLQVLGNHEFDNGIESLARYYVKDAPVKLSSNYDFSGTPLAGVFAHHVIKKIGGKKVGFMGLNLNPDGIIGADNSRGLVYKDIVAVADSTAALLRSKGCSLVVAVTHIGYTDDTGRNLLTDPQLAAATSGIDIIIGGHSHTVVAPSTKFPNVVNNRDGRPVLIAQTGRYGENLGYIKLDLSRPGVENMQARMIPVAGIDSSRFDRKLLAYLAPYAHVVDSINHRRIAFNEVDMLNTKKYALSVPLTNMAADIARLYADACLDSIAGAGLPRRVDLAIINSGGIRLPFPKGEVTEGQVLSAFPFTNHIVVTEFKGSDLVPLLAQAARQEGQGVSEGTLVALDDKGQVKGILVNGRPIDSSRTYYVATLNYLAEGGDYLDKFKKGRVVWSDSKDFCAPVMQYVVEMGRAGLPLNPDIRPRIVRP